jgi:hypothetical protein
MLQVYTTKHKRNGERGNCLAAAFASILELQIQDIPQFEEMTRETWRKAVVDWGYNNCINIQFSKERPKGYAIGVGVHPEGGLHAVVVLNGEFCFDVNGSDLFYVEHRYYIHVKRVKQSQVA